MKAGFFGWLEAVLGPLFIVPLVFDARPLLVLAQIGVALTVFALSELGRVEEKIHSFHEQAIAQRKRRKSPGPDDPIRRYPAYLKLLKALVRNGTLYIGVTPVLVVVAGELHPVQGIAAFFVNLGFFSVVFSTTSNALVFVRYVIQRG